MSSRSSVIRAAGERFTSLLGTMALPRLYFTGFFAAPLLQTIYNSLFVAFLHWFWPLFSPALLYAGFVFLACNIEFRDRSIFLRSVHEEVCVSVGCREQRVPLKEAEINLIVNSSKHAAPVQEPVWGLAGSRKSLLLTLMIQPRLSSSQHQSRLSAV